MLNCNGRDQLLLRQVAVLEEILKTLQRIEVKLSATPRLGRVGRVLEPSQVKPPVAAVTSESSIYLLRFVIMGPSF